MKLYELQNRTPLMDALVSVWENSVRATHHFLSDEEILKIKTYVPLNCTPFVRQYDILSNKWGVLLCQKEYQTNDIRQNSKNW